MKKKIVVCVFSVLIAVTVIGFVADAAATYAYEMDPANGEDIFEGFGAFILCWWAFSWYCLRQTYSTRCITSCSSLKPK